MNNTIPQTDGNLPLARKELADAIHNLAGRTRSNIERHLDQNVLDDIEQRYQADQERINNRHNTAIARADRAGAAGLATRTIEVERRLDLTNLQQRYEERVVALTTTTDWNDGLYQQLADMIGGAQGTQLGATARSMPPIWIDASDKLHEIDTAVEAWQPDAGAADDPSPETVRRLYLLEDRKWRPQDVHNVEQIAAAITAWTAEIRALLNPTPKWSLPNPCPACHTATVYRKDSAGETVRQPALQIGAHGCECQKCHTVWAPDYFVHLGRVLGYELPEGVLE